MAVLQNFPMMSQLADTQEANREFDCVPTCIAASLQYLTGKSYDAAAIKDEVYGKGYTGGTAASEYVAYCARQGVKLAAYNGIPGALVSKAHQLVRSGIPAILTEPDPYADPKLDWTHVCVFYAEGPGYLVAMDPYPLPGISTGHPVHHTDQQWTELLLDNQLWTLEKEEESIVIDLNVPIIAQHFQGQGSAWLCKSTGKNIHGEILKYYQNSGTKPYCGYSELGLPLSNEIPLDSDGSTKQHFERGVLLYDPHGKYGPPSGAGAVYPAQLYNGGPGSDPALVDLEKQLADAKAAPTLVQNAQAITVIGQIKKLVEPF
jgi:hypothetical protein